MIFSLLTAFCLAAPRASETQLEGEIFALRQSLSRMEAELARCAAPAGTSRLRLELQQVFAGAEVEVIEANRTLTVRIPASYLFVPGEGAGLREEATMALDLLGTALRLHPIGQVTVEGHTHDLRDLSVAGASFRVGYERAEQVATALISFGLDPARLTLASRGAMGPLASNDLPSGQARNERVEVHIRAPEPPVKSP